MEMVTNDLVNHSEFSQGDKEQGREFITLAKPTSHPIIKKSDELKIMMLKIKRSNIIHYGEELRNRKLRSGKQGFMIGKFRKLLTKAISDYVEEYNRDYSYMDKYTKALVQ